MKFKRRTTTTHARAQKAARTRWANKRKFPCANCDRKFATEADLRFHQEDERLEKEQAEYFAGWRNPGKGLDPLTHASTGEHSHGNKSHRAHKNSDKLHFHPADFKG